MKIVVLGAYGYTGSLVCEQLAIADIEFSIAGRDKSKLDALNTSMSTPQNIELVDILNAKQVKTLVENYDVFINCIGPFTETAKLIVAYVAKTNKMYLDITGESVFVQNSYEKHHKEALANKATIIHSCAFESVLADVLGTSLIQGLKEIDTINSYYLMAKGRPSPGTRLTMKLSVFRQPTFMINGEKIHTSSIERKEMTWEGMDTYATIPYPLPEICFFEWKTSARNIASYLLMDRAEAKYLNRSSIDQKTKEEILDLFNKRKPKGPKEVQRQSQKFTLIISAKDVENKHKTLKVAGSDMYLMTAKIITFFVEKYMKGEANKGLGVMSPAAFLKEGHDLFEKLNLRMK